MYIIQLRCVCSYAHKQHYGVHVNKIHILHYLCIYYFNTVTGGVVSCVYKFITHRTCVSKDISSNDGT